MKMVDFNIEFAHVTFDKRKIEECLFDVSAALKSSQITQNIIRKIKELDKTYSTSILVDNKHLDFPLNDSCLTKLLDFVSEEVSVDFLFLESNLSLYLDKALLNVIYSKRDVLREKIRARIAEGRQITCSQDIAIWHLIRLGKIKRSKLDGMVKLTKRKTTLTAKKVISVLPIDMKHYEKTAVRDFLRHAIDTSVVNKVFVETFDSNFRKSVRPLSSGLEEFLRE